MANVAQISHHGEKSQLKQTHFTIFQEKKFSLNCGINVEIKIKVIKLSVLQLETILDLSRPIYCFGLGIKSISLIFVL